MKAKIVFLSLVLVLFEPLFGANTANHTVSLVISEINELSITGGNITLTISTATAGSDPDAATDSTCILNITTNKSGTDPKKITVTNGTVVSESGATFTVGGTSISGATVESALDITGITAVNFVTGLEAFAGLTTLTYTWDALASDGTLASEAHIITYTLSDT